MTIPLLDSKNKDVTAAMDPVLKAGVAHLWFGTTHPFDDGKGRIARSRTWRSPGRKSARSGSTACPQIRPERRAYYDILERTQRETMDITPWMDWFLGCLGRAIDAAQTTLTWPSRLVRHRCSGQSGSTVIGPTSSRAGWQDLGPPATDLRSLKTL